MKKQELYNKTVNILVDAYFNDRLIANDCTACACGNLVAAANDYEMVKIGEDSWWRDKNDNYLWPSWGQAVCTESHYIFGIRLKTKQGVNIDNYDEVCKAEVQSTGYNFYEFALIEKYFEKGYRGRDKMYNALVSVIKALDIIHDNQDKQLTKTTINKFVKA